MKKLVCFIVLIIVCVSCHKEVTQKDKFLAFLNTIPDLKIPFQTNSSEELYSKYELDTIYKKIIDDSFNGIYGKVAINDSIYGIVYLVAGDIVFPLLITYNKGGKKIEELSLLHIPGGSDGYNGAGTSYLQMNQNFDIQITDTLYSFERDSAEVIIESSRKTEVTIESYNISADGKFFQKELNYENKH